MASLAIARQPEESGVSATDTVSPATPHGGVVVGGGVLHAGDWDSGNPAFALSREPCGSPAYTPSAGSRVPGMLWSPSGFRRPVSRVALERVLLARAAWCGNLLPNFRAHRRATILRRRIH